MPFRPRLTFPLRYLLIMLTAIGLLPLALLGAWSIHTVSDYQQREQERLMLDLARAISSAADAELDGVVATLTSLGRDPSLQANDLRGFYQVARKVAHTQAEWQGVIVTDDQGKILFRTMDDYGAATQPIADPSSLVAVQTTWQPVVGHIALGRRGQPAFPVRAPVETADGRRYVLTAVIRPDRIMRLIGRQQVPHGAITTIRDSAKVVVARSKSQEAMVGKPPSQSLLDLMKATGAEGVGLAFTSEGKSMTTAYTTASRYGWMAVVGRPADQMHAAGLQSLGVYGIGILISLVMCIAAALLLSRRLVGKINTLQHNAAALASGAPLQLAPSSVREFADISKGLEQAERLRSAQEHERQLLLDALNQTLASNESALAEARAAGRAKDEFLAVLGHELRNPLSPIVTSLDLLDRRGDPASGKERAVMRRQVQHLRRLVDDLLDVSRIISGKFELEAQPVNLAEVVRHAVAALPGQRVILSAPLAVWVMGDDSRLTQVLNNLLSNAERFGSTATEVTLSADDGHARLVVSDNGIGMSEELLARVFEPFQQAPQSLARRTGGLGLGLAIVRKIVELHDGQVVARSGGSGQGSQFEVILPLTALKRSELTINAPSLPAGLDVLLVDDNVDAASTGGALLELMGNQVRLAHSGAEALAAQQQRAPDVAILDIGLPDMDGYALARAMRQQAGERPLRLVALTGYGQKEDVEKAYQAEFDLHLTKPATLADLQRATAPPTR